MPGKRTRGGSRVSKQQPKRHKMHVRRGDRVRVIRGNFAGAEGTILRVLPKENRVVVEGVNQRTKHQRPTPESEGGRIHFEAPIHASNVMLLDPKTDEPTRYRTQIDDDGTKERISVKSGQTIPKQHS